MYMIKMMMKFKNILILKILLLLLTLITLFNSFHMGEANFYCVVPEDIELPDNP